MGIVRFALKFPYTCYVLAALIVYLGLSAIIHGVSGVRGDPAVPKNHGIANRHYRGPTRTEFCFNEE
jgi:hypothetical protein